MQNLKREISKLQIDNISMWKKISQLEDLYEHQIRKYKNPIELETDVFEFPENPIILEDGKEYISEISTIKYANSFKHKETKTLINTYVVSLVGVKNKYIMYRQNDARQPEPGNIIRHLVKSTSLINCTIISHE